MARFSNGDRGALWRAQPGSEDPGCRVGHASPARRAMTTRRRLKMTDKKEWPRVRIRGATELDDVITEDFPAQGARRGPRCGDTEWCFSSWSELERGKEMTLGSSRWPMRTRRASANAAPAEETVRWRAVCVAGPAVHVRWCVGFGLGRVGPSARTGWCLRADRARARARAEAEAVARDRIGTEL